MKNCIFLLLHEIMILMKILEKSVSEQYKDKSNIEKPGKLCGVFVVVVLGFFFFVFYDVKLLYLYIL